jgi:hypothetical protein
MSALQEMLLQQMLAGQTPDPEQMDRMLEAVDDPRLQLVARYMRESARTPAIEQVPADAPANNPPRDAAAGLRRRLERVIRLLRTTQALADTAAAALGACYLCWGDDPGCEYCAGHGTPGWIEPDPELFELYVEPALARHRSAVHGAAHRVHDTPPNRSPSDDGSSTEGASHDTL